MAHVIYADRKNKRASPSESSSSSSAAASLSLPCCNFHCVMNITESLRRRECISTWHLQCIDGKSCVHVEWSTQCTQTTKEKLSHQPDGIVSQFITVFAYSFSIYCLPWLPIDPKEQQHSDIVIVIKIEQSKKILTLNELSPIWVQLQNLIVAIGNVDSNKEVIVNEALVNGWYARFQ